MSYIDEILPHLPEPPKEHVMQYLEHLDGDPRNNALANLRWVESNTESEQRSESLGDLIANVRFLRIQAEAARITLTIAQQRFQEEHAALFADVEQTKAAVTQEENALRAKALEAYTRTHQKQLAPGVGIREMTLLAYEQADAVAWAQTHNLCLIPATLDVAAFEAIAKTLHLDFVHIITTPKVTLSKTL